MSNDVNRIFVTGRLTQDPVMRYLPSGTAKCEMRLATSRTHQGKEETCYVDVVAWSRQAEVCQSRLSKGSHVLVEGRLDYSEWKKEGQRRSKHLITSTTIKFL